MAENMQAAELLEKLENKNIQPIDNQSVSDSGIADVGSLLGAIPGEESVIFEQLLAAMPQPNETPENDQSPAHNTVLGMDLV